MLDRPVVNKSTKTCNWEEWNTYLNRIADSIEKASLEVDVAEENVGGRISNNLEKSVEESLLVPIDDIENGMECTFIRDRYRGFYSSVCMEFGAGASGLTGVFMVFGILCWLAIVVEMVMWRRVVMAQDMANSREL